MIGNTPAHHGGCTTTTSQGVAHVAPNGDGAQPVLLTLEQAAALCGVCPRTLWGWAHDGISPSPVRIGKGTTRYVRSDYLAWIAGGCKPLNGHGGQDDVR